MSKLKTQISNLKTNKIQTHYIKSSAIPLPIENIDTDQIIPARYLKATVRENFGDKLFRDWRFDEKGKERNFILNNPKFKGSILVAGKNFGCGSSREHAAWALSDYGFHVIISSYFADIFKNNALNNGLLPVQMDESSVKTLLTEIQSDPTIIIKIDVAKQTISIPALGITKIFEINPYKKICIMNGYDDIDYLINLKGKIKSYEKNDSGIAG